MYFGCRDAAFPMRHSKTNWAWRHQLHTAELQSCTPNKYSPECEAHERNSYVKNWALADPIIIFQSDIAK